MIGFLFFALAIISANQAQGELFITRLVIGNATISSDPPGQTHLEFTASVGEPISGTVNGDIIATTGFQQPDDDVITSTIEVGSQWLTVSYFPNPAKEWLPLTLGKIAVP